MSETTAAETNTGTEIPGELEAKAREMGWKPKDEWVGDDSGWRDAEEFIEQQERRAEKAALTENRELRDELDRLRREQTETRQTLEDFKEHHSKVSQKAYERALKDIQARQRQAVEAGDTDAFDAAAKEADDLMKDAATPQENKPRQDNPDEIPAFKSFAKANKWYGNDYEMTAYAEQIGPHIIRNERLDPTDSEFYDRIGEEVRKRFPDKFTNPKRDKASAVEAGTGGGGKKKGKTAADLPPEAKAAGQRYVDQGLYPDGGLEEYAKEYFELED